MNIESIKKLIKEGDVPQARSQLREVLSKTPEDAVAQMLYGTCCQIMGDPETFGRIYQKLAPEMKRCVERGEKSERISMWLKYAAMFALVFTCFCGVLGADHSLEGSNVTNVTKTENDVKKAESPFSKRFRDAQNSQATADDLSVIRMAKEVPDGVQIFADGNGGFKLISCGCGIYDFNDEDEIMDARSEATRNAKTHIVKFFKENFSTEEQATNAMKKAKSQHKEGNTEQVSVSKEQLKTIIEVAKSDAREVLSGVVVLKDEKIPSPNGGGRVFVIVEWRSQNLKRIRIECAPLYGGQRFERPNRPLTKYAGPRLRRVIDTDF